MMKRVRYRKSLAGVTKFVIADIDLSTGRGDYAEQEPAEIVWHAFSPADDERRAVVALAAGAAVLDRWPILPLSAPAAAGESSCSLSMGTHS